MCPSSDGIRHNGTNVDRIADDEIFAAYHKTPTGIGTIIISSYGRVFAIKEDSEGFYSVELPHKVDSDGYPVVFFGYHAYRIDKMMCSAFIPNPDGSRYVIHKDSDRKNISLGNLRWRKAGEYTRNKPPMRGNKKHEIVMVDISGKLCGTYPSCAALDEELNLCHGYISGILRGHRLMRRKYFIFFKKDFDEGKYSLIPNKPVRKKKPKANPASHTYAKKDNTYTDRTILMIDSDGNTVKEYANAQIMAADLGVNPGTISTAIYKRSRIKKKWYAVRKNGFSHDKFMEYIASAENFKAPKNFHCPENTYRDSDGRLYTTINGENIYINDDEDDDN